MIEDLIKYLVEMESLMVENGIYNEILIEEISIVAIDNWVNTGVPNLTEKQLEKVLMISLIKNINFN